MTFASSDKVEPITACVFGSSSNKTSQSFLDASYAMGKLLAERGHGIVTGGGAFGCMQGVQSGCRQHGGKVQGVVHQQFIDGGSADLDNVSDMIIAKGDDLEERKRLLMDHAQCLLVCPGGVGTFDEFWDCVSHRSLDMKGLTGKPIILLNIDGYYDGFVAQLSRAAKEALLYNQVAEYFTVANSPEQAVELMEQEVTQVRRGAMSNAWVNAMSERRKGDKGDTSSRSKPDEKTSNKMPVDDSGSSSCLSPAALVQSLLFWTKIAEQGGTDPSRRQERRGLFLAGACWGIAVTMVVAHFKLIPIGRKK